MDELNTLRGEIDAIDRELTALFLRRMNVTARVGAYKQARGIPVLDAEREREVLRAKAALTDDATRRTDVTALFEAIMGISRRQQRQLVQEPASGGYARVHAAMAAARPPLAHPTILYQGLPGAYTEEAAVGFFGEDCPRHAVEQWEDLFLALREGRADYGVIPIENSSTGAISQVYDLLAEYGAYIVGEQKVRVEHCLLATRGATLDGIRAVYSHEQGLRQCAGYLKEHGAWSTHPRRNTAEAARFVAQSGDRACAAIGSRRAARLYGLDILSEHIAVSAHNFTRFVVIAPTMELRAGRNKISALFVLPHRSGTLHEIMSIFAVNGLNMMKLESRPIPERSWEYRFFVDFTGDLTAPDMDGILLELNQTAEDFRVLGNYKAAQP